MSLLLQIFLRLCPASSGSSVIQRPYSLRLGPRLSGYGTFHPGDQVEPCRPLRLQLPRKSWQ